MRKFQLIDARSVREAATLLERYRGKAVLIAGGGDLLHMLKDRIEGPRLPGPDFVINLETIPDLNYIRYQPGKGLTIGAMASISALEASAIVKEKFGLLSQAAGSVASPQLRNFVTLGGNLCQKPRCWYYRNRGIICLKKGGSTCHAQEGDNRYYHAILEGGPCYIVHPSDMAPALVALDAKVKVAGPKDDRTVPLEKFFVNSEQNLYNENVLGPGELISEVEVPEPAPNTRPFFFKARIRQSWDFALASVAASITSRNGTIQASRIVLGGVAPLPYRATVAEEALAGKRLDEASAQAASQALAAEAKPMSMNAYKVRLAANLVRRAVLGTG